MHQPVTLPPLVIGSTCDACGQPAAQRGGHYSVHFPSVTAMRPCPRSWPTPRSKP